MIATKVREGMKGGIRFSKRKSPMHLRRASGTSESERVSEAAGRVSSTLEGRRCS